MKLLTYQNLVNYRIIPVGFKLSKLKGNKGEALSEEEEEQEKEKEEGNHMTRTFYSVHLLFTFNLTCLFLCFFRNVKTSHRF